MTKILEIKECGLVCSGFNWDKKFCQIKQRLFDKSDTAPFPSWCPLPEKTEPITLEQIRIILAWDLQDTAKTYCERVLKAINDHFLGEK